VGSRIVFEAMMNAVRHPGAEYIQTGSLLNKRRSPVSEQSGSSQNRHFTVSFWDDGRTMYETLANALSNDLSIRYGYLEKFDTTYELSFIDENSSFKAHPVLISSRETPEKGSSSQRLLLATLYPGVTCDVTGKRA
jgi:hypothetical protein